MPLTYFFKVVGKCHHGFSLLEVLIALVVLAIGMPGIANMLLVAHKTNSSSSAYDIIDRIRANRQAAINGNYNVNNLVTTGSPSTPSAPSANCNTAICSSTQMAAYDSWFWLASDVTQLPNGCGAVTTAVSGVSTLVTVTVQWDDSPTQKVLGASSSTPVQLIIQSEL